VNRGEVELGPADGMPRACVLNADNVASLPKGYLGDLTTTLSNERLAEVYRALDRATGC
jgi:mRNA-degrading endonuclease toxin of MazEF toxin-antitoxin module